MAVSRKEVFAIMHREDQNELAMKLLEVAQAHYQNSIKLMRRKKKNDE
ncbi:hypothetical protein GOBAR_AA37897 [Gossypium barbadense]|uniref:Uncharacterized protein n=1 Tax=Gossypium barbadense TaxID=3634 RepID=A0A2P5VVF3_GOSBA|nr:hypothetical protein GOBAR_AA37897 [Gossypium barbadense]